MNLFAVVVIFWLQIIEPYVMNHDWDTIYGNSLKQEKKKQKLRQLLTISFSQFKVASFSFIANSVEGNKTGILLPNGQYLAIGPGTQLELRWLNDKDKEPF